jgi:hypothetical protein
MDMILGTLVGPRR